MRGASSRNVSPAVAPGGDELGRVLQLGADHADLRAVDVEHDRRRQPAAGSPVAVSTMFVARNGKFAPRDVLVEALDAVVELVVA